MLPPRSSKASAKVSRSQAYPNYLCHKKLMFAMTAADGVDAPL
jgi:hypothetical protein